MIKRKKQKLNNPFYDPRLKARHASANRFKKFTLTSLVFSIVFLGFFLFDIVGKGIPAFNIAYVQMNITINEKSLDDTRFAIDKEYREVVSRAWLRDLPTLVKEKPELMNTTTPIWVLADDQVDQYLKGNHHKLKDKEIEIVDRLNSQGLIEKRFNTIL